MAMAMAARTAVMMASSIADAPRLASARRTRSRRARSARSRCCTTGWLKGFWIMGYSLPDRRLGTLAWSCLEHPYDRGIGEEHQEPGAQQELRDEHRLRALTRLALDLRQ